MTNCEFDYVVREKAGKTFEVISYFKYFADAMAAIKNSNHYREVWGLGYTGEPAFKFIHSSKDLFI